MSTSPTGLPPIPSFATQYPQTADEWNVFIRWLLNVLQGISSNSSLGLTLGLSLPQPQSGADQFRQGSPFPPNPAMVQAAKAQDEVNTMIAYLLTKSPYRNLQGGLILYGTRAQRQATDPGGYGLGTVWMETDSGLEYAVLPDPYVVGNPNQWFYQFGVAFIEWQFRNTPGSMWAGSAAAWGYTDTSLNSQHGQGQLGANLIVGIEPLQANISGTFLYNVQISTEPTADPTTWTCNSYYLMGTWQNEGSGAPGDPLGNPLLAFDAGFLQACWGSGHVWRWDGLTFEWAGPEIGSGFCVLSPIGPESNGAWWQQVPVGGGSITVSDSAGDSSTSFTYPAYTSLNTLNPGWFLYARL